MLKALVIDGVLEERSEQAFKDLVRRHKGLVTISIRPYSKQRSVDQNALYWQLLTILADEVPDYAPKQWHEIFKTMFAPRAVVKVGSKSLEIVGTTQKMSTKQFTIYMDRIRAEVAEQFGFQLPTVEELEHYFPNPHEGTHTA
jgi:hypothetical protein